MHNNSNKHVVDQLEVQMHSTEINHLKKTTIVIPGCASDSAIYVERTPIFVLSVSKGRSFLGQTVAVMIRCPGATHRDSETYQWPQSILLGLSEYTSGTEGKSSSVSVLSKLECMRSLRLKNETGSRWKDIWDQWLS